MGRLTVCLAALLSAGCVHFTAKEAKMDTKDFYVGRIADCMRIADRHPRLAKALDFLSRPDLATLPCGRYEIDGDNCWAMVQDADLKPFGDVQRPEVHGAYIDIQAPITGPETIGLLSITPEARAEIAFDAKKDIGFFDAKTEPVTLRPGDFAVLMPPLGAHAPCRSLDGARSIRKLVIKIRN